MASEDSTPNTHRFECGYNPFNDRTIIASTAIFGLILVLLLALAGWRPAVAVKNRKQPVSCLLKWFVELAGLVFTIL